MRTSSIPSKSNGSATMIADKVSEKDFSKALQPLINKILAAESLDEIIFESSKEICQIFNADRATIYTLSEDQSYLSTRVKTGASLQDLKLPLIQGSIVNYVSINKQPVNIEDVYHKGELRKIEPSMTFSHDVDNEDTRAEVESPVDRVLSEGRVVGLANHTLLVARDGTDRPIADSGAPVRRDDGVLEGVVLVFRDQSAERQAYNALRASETRFRRLFEGTADALLLLDMDRQRFIDCNFATVAMLGLDSRDEVLQTHPAELSPPQQADGRESQEKAGDMIETARREGFHRFEWLHSTRARGAFPVDVILTP